MAGLPRGGYAPGDVLAGEYRILRPLKTGGMGAVYVAEQISTGATRALKVMLPELVADATLRRRFELEAQAAGRIPSEHVVQVVGTGVDEQTGTPFIAMELLEGNDLAEHVRAHGPLAPALARAVFEQAGHALAAAHRAGIVHRDLKPENVYLASSRRSPAGSTPFTVKLLDFGIAKMTVEQMTSRSTAMASLPWMAPEQATAGATTTPAIDVWALGLLAFYALTGRTLWRATNQQGGTDASLMKEILFDRIPVASTRARELGVAHLLPDGFDSWFARAVTRNASARHRDAGEACAALDPVLARAPQPAVLDPALAPTQPVAQVVRAPARRSVHFWIGMGALVVYFGVSAVLVVWSTLHRSRTDLDTPAGICAAIVGGIEAGGGADAATVDLSSVRSKCVASMTTFASREPDAYGCSQRCIGRRPDVAHVRTCLKSCNAPAGTDSFLDGASP